MANSLFSCLAKLSFLFWRNKYILTFPASRTMKMSLCRLAQRWVLNAYLHCKTGPCALPSLALNFIFHIHSLCSQICSFPRRKKHHKKTGRLFHTNYNILKIRMLGKRSVVFWCLPTKTMKAQPRSVHKGRRLERGRGVTGSRQQDPIWQP